ncbi:MAG TPA: flagellar hook-length control protein FliK [Anaeromyxobacter sp.]|nr:flagellar hook-length control protein FliK [Anaeromyxobacter sp.]
MPATEPPGRTPADALRANDARGGATIAKRGKQLELDGREEAQGSVTPTPPPPAAAGTTPAPAEPRTEPTRTRPVAPPLPALPVEPGEAVVSGAVLPAAAHLHLSSETLGELALHLRIQDGAAHVRVEGGSRAAVEARTPELVRALAAEGLGLARLEHEPRNAQPPGGAGTSGDLSRDGNGGSRDASERHGGAHAGDEPPPRSSSSRTEPRAARGASRTHGGSHDVTA